MVRYYCFLLCLVCAFTLTFPHLYAQAPAWATPHAIGSSTVGDKTFRNAVDAGGNVYYIGHIAGNADFDLTGSAAGDVVGGGMFLVKYDAAGTFQWVVKVNSGGTAPNSRYSLALDGAGNIFITGSFSGVGVDFNPLGAPVTISSAGLRDIVYARYSPAGLCQWAKAVGGPGEDEGLAIAVNPGGTTLYVGGYFVSATADFDPSGAMVNLSCGTQSGFLASYDGATGNYNAGAPAFKIDGTGVDFVRDLALDGSGNVWAVGDHTNGADFDPGGPTVNLAAALRGFVAEYSGALGYLNAFNTSTNAASVRGVKVDVANNVYVIGSFSAFGDFDPGAGTVNRGSAGIDPYIASYTSAGAFRWVTTPTGGATDDGVDIAIDNAGKVYGIFQTSSAPFDIDGDVNFTAGFPNLGLADMAWGAFDAATGRYLRGALIGSAMDDFPQTIAADAAGNVYIGGDYSATMDADPRPGANVQTVNLVSTALDMFFAKYTPTAAQTYTWTGAGVWATPVSWTPNRDYPSSDDILSFPAGSWPVNSIPFQQIGRLVFDPASIVTMQASINGSFLLVNGDAAAFDVDIPSGASLNLGNGVTQAAIRVTTGSVCNVAGTVSITALPNYASYVGGWGTLNVTNTGALTTAGPNGINGNSLGTGAVRIDMANGGTTNYDVASGFGFTNNGVTGFQAVAGKPAITQAKNLKCTVPNPNGRILLDNTLTLSGTLSIDGAGANGRLCVTSANVLTLGPVGNVIDASTSNKALEVISGTVNNPNVGGLTFIGPGLSRLILRNDMVAGTSGLFTGNPPTYSAISQLEYIINTARTTTDAEIPPAGMGGPVVVNGFAGSPTLTLNNGKIFNEFVTVSNGTLAIGGVTTINGVTTLGNAAPPTSGKINLNNQSLTLNANMQTFAASSFIGSAASNLTLGDGNDTFAGNLTFDPGTRLLNNYTVNLGAANNVNQTGDLSIGGILTLTQGKITGTSPIGFLRVTNPAPTSVARTNGWVAGPLERQMLPNIIADGTNYIFPIGDVPNYRPASLQNVRTGAGTPQIRMTYANAGAATFNPPVTGFASGQNWRVEDVSVGFVSSTIALDNGVAPPANARVGQSAAQAGMYSTINGAAVGNVVTSAPLLATSNQYYAVVIAPLPGPMLVAPAPVPATNSNTTAFGAMTDITLSYNENMNPPGAANIFVHGSVLGYRSGATFSQPSASQLRTTPLAGMGFRPGEVVSVTVTNATSVATGNNPRPHVYSFRTAAGAGPGTFYPIPPIIPIGINLHSCAVADVNKDGNLDAIILENNLGAAKIHVAFGNGVGGFAAPTAYPLVGGPPQGRGVTAADFNNDGWIDIAVANIAGGPGNANIFLNNGSGGFGAAIASAGIASANRIAAADFNGDGNMDIAVCSFGGGNVRIALGNGTGAMPMVNAYGVFAPSVNGVCAGDFDNDGDADLAVVDGVNVFYLTNNGLGVFAVTGTYPSAGCISPQAADMDEDGDLDIVFQNGSANVPILVNNGLGGFVLNNIPSGIPAASDVVIGNFDNDPRIDIFCTDYAKGVLLRNMGGLSFTQLHAGSVNNLGTFSAGDFDNDGDLDLLGLGGGVGTELGAILKNGIQPVLTALSPTRNTNLAPFAATITPTYTQTMTTATASAPVMKVFGGFTGLRTGAYSGGGGTTPSMMSAAPFRSGEQVWVTVTSAQTSLAGSVGIAARPQVYGFRAQTGGGTGRFVDSRRYESPGASHVAYADVDGVNGIDLIQGGADLFVRLNDGMGNFASTPIKPYGAPPPGNVGHTIVGDWDNDGLPDIAFLSPGATTMRFVRNLGGGAFNTAAFPNVTGLSGNPVRITSADFDGDGDLDIVVAANAVGRLQLYLNNGAGTFTLSSFDVPAPAANTPLAADADNDGDIDIILSCDVSATVEVWLNSGFGTFTTPTAPWQYGGMTGLQLITSGDFNNDGFIDIVAGGGTNNIFLLRNQGTGNGQFFAPVVINTGGGITVPIVGNFDGDPNLDVAVVMPALTDNKVFFYQGDGTGALTLLSSQAFMETIPVGGQFITPAAADIDGDGDLDLAVPLNSERTAILFNHQPEIKAPTSFPAPNANTAPTAPSITYTFNQNVTTASATFNSGTANVPIRVWGTMTARQTFTGNMAGATATLSAPVKPYFPNERVDFTIGTSVTIAAPMNTVAMTTGTVRQFWRQPLVGPYTPQANLRTTLTPGIGTDFVETADVNNDGNLDIVVGYANGDVRAYIGDALGNFVPGALQANPAPMTHLTLGDVNNDGNIDIVTANNAGNCYAFLGTGTGSFGIGLTVSPGGLPQAVALGDMDGDGNLDIVVARGGTNDFAVARGLGNGNFAASAVFPAGGTFCQHVAVGDVDADGILDIVATNNTSPNVTFLRGLGAMKFVPATIFSTLVGAASSTLRDLNGDGFLDVLVMSNAAPGNVERLHWNNVTKVFNTVETFPLTGFAGQRTIALGDIDGNGTADITLATPVGGVFRRLGNTATSNLSDPGGIPSGPNSRWAAVGDFNNDGKLDYALTNIGDELRIYLNAGQPRFVCMANCGPVTYTPNIAPQRNVNNALAASLLSWQFTEPMTTATAAFPGAMQGPIRIFGAMTGGRTPSAGGTGTWTYTAGTTTATFAPSAVFRPGEQVMVSVTSAQSMGGIHARPYVYSYRVATGVGPGTFFEPSNSPYPAGAAAFDGALADVDGDGDLDMAVANQTGNNVVLRLNDGSGGFANAHAMSPFGAFNGVTSVRFGDVNNDGRVDMITCNNAANTISVRLNNGAGDFSANAPGSPLGGGFNLPFSATLADVDGDGDLDLIVANDVGGNVMIRLNNGAGDFTTPALGSPYAIGANTFGVVSGDVDNDGDMDIIATASAVGATVLFNDGTGRFSIGPVYGGGTGVQVPIVGDIDNDGDLDLAMPNSGSNTVTVRLNNGLGDFTTQAPGSPLAMGIIPRAISFGDIDGDGDLDLVSANNDILGVIVRLNSGTGDFSTFGKNSPIATGGLRGLALGDVDGDGDLDIAIPVNASATASILMNATQPRFVCSANCGPVTYTPNIAPQRNVNNALTTSLLTWQFTEPMTAATTQVPTAMGGPIRIFGGMTGQRSVNLGGAWAYNAATTTASFMPSRSFLSGEEVMVSVTSAQSTSRINTRPYVYSFRARVGSGPGVFVPHTQSPVATGTNPRDVALGDIDGDGDVDMLIASLGGVVSHLNNGIGNFSAGTNIVTLASPVAIALGDADNDGDLDIAVCGANQVSVLLNTAGMFTTMPGFPVPIAGADFLDVQWGDLDGDGDLDLALANSAANQVNFGFNNIVAGTFTLPMTGVGTTGAPATVRITDINNDGDMDVLAAINSGMVGMAIVENNGFGGFALAGAPVATPSFAHGITSGDIDGDGDNDALVTLNSANSVAVFSNNGSGFYTLAGTFASGTQPRYVQLGDVDGDGDLDMIASNSGSHTATVRLNNGSGDFSVLATASPYALGLSPQGLALADLDGDGDVDIVSANSASNNASVLLNQASNGLAFSLINVAAQEGFNSSNPTVLSRVSTPFVIGSFLGQTLLLPTTATLQYSIQALPGGTAQFSIQGYSGAALNSATSLSTQATFIWNNAPVGGGSTQATIIIVPAGASSLNSTQITVTVIAAPAYPLALAMSQVSSTGTHGINAGAFNVGQLQIVNGKPFNVAFGAWNGWSALAATQATVQSFLTGSGGETIGFTITNATFTLNNRAADTLRNIAITWESPLALTTTVTLRLSVVGGAPLQSTTVSLVLTTSPLEPQITSFTPTTGATTSVVTVQGLNLGNVTAMRVGGVPVQNFTINSPTQISIVVSTGATGFITATNLAGTGQSLVPFTFVVPPSGLMLSSTQAGVGQTITVSGNNLAGAQNVFVGGLSAMFASTMSGQLLVIIPPGAQSGVVTVQTVGGSANSPTLAIIPSPSISSVAPTPVAGGGMITITGANLTNVTSVTIGGIPVTSFMVISSTQIVAVVSFNAVSAPVQVLSAGGMAFSTTNIVVALPPTLTSVSNTMPNAGTQVFIGGSGFTPGMIVTIGGVPVPLVQVNSPSEAIITMPANATNGTLTVTTPFGSNSFSMTISVAPGVVVPFGIDFTPVTGSFGTTVTIVGQGFVGVREVSFGGVSVQRFTVESSVRILAVLSTGATGTARVVTTTGSAESQRIFTYNSPLQLDSIAAVSFFLMTDGFRWTTTANWLTRQPLQSWHGLTVQGGRITSIALPNNNVNGSLTSAIVQLSAISGLKTLNLSGSRLPGVLPSAIGTMRTLRTLNLSASGLSGTIPKELATLDSLEVLRLDTNKLTGSPEEIMCSLGTTSSRAASRLREFRVNNNQLSGVIPPCVVEFRQLEVLHLQNNRFTGGIPERITDIEGLRELMLANNALSGALPSSFNRTFTGKSVARTTFFSTLERLDIGGNGFAGTFPQGISQFAALKELRLNDNAFVGALPPTLTSLTKLEVLDASRNRLAGTLPDEIGSMRRLRHLLLTNTTMSGAIPESLGECDLLERLELDSNGFTGALPLALGTWQNLRVLGLARNRFTSLTTLSALRSPLETLRLQSNSFTFESIEGNIGARNFTYTPQDSVGTAQSLGFQPQSRIELTISVGGSANRYQWFKNGVAFGSPSSSGFFLLSEKASEAESGTYECRITNSRAPALTLFSRPWEIRVDSSAQAPVQSDAVGQPILIFPTNNARFVSYSPLLRWSGGEGARQYEVQLSTSASFASVVTTAIISSTALSVSALQPSVRYYWRVRSIGRNSVQSAWAQALFTTANAERPLQMSSVDFERVPIRETSIREAVVTNFSSLPQILRDITILSDVPNDTNRVFRVVDDIRDAVIPAGQSLTVKIAFTPRIVGNTSATSVLAYQQRPQDGARRDSTRNILQGIGGGLKMDNVDFDTVRAGGTSIKSADLVNLSSRTIHLKRPSIPDALQTENGVFAIESYLGSDEIELRPLDTVQVVVRCRVPESSVGRKLAGVLVFGEGDSVQATVRAIARPLRQNDVVVNVEIKPVVDNLPPGSLAELDVRLRINPITSATVGDVYRAIEPRFQGKFQMSRQVLTLDASESIATGQILGDAVSVSIPPTGWELQSADKDKREVSILKVKTRVVAGTTNVTSLQIESASFAPPLIKGASTVFVEAPVNIGTFTAKISQAGGKRLIGSTEKTVLRAVALKGALEIAYSLAEAGNVELSLYDVLGRKIQTLTDAYHQAADYKGVFRTDNLYSGSYFLILRTRTGITQQRVDVLR